MQCPQCSSTLKRIVYEDVPIHACDSCGGEFIGGPSLQEMISARRRRSSPELAALLAEHRPSFDGSERQPSRSLICPACGEPMALIDYGSDSGIFVDRCESCDGLWLPRSELDKVQSAMERWADGALKRLQVLAGDVEMARRRTGEHEASRYAFVHALINRLLDAA